jgi:hypothetical protein
MFNQNNRGFIMRYVTFFTLLIIILTFQFLPAQAPYTLWTITFGGIGNEYGSSVQQTIDGGYIVVGNKYSFGSGYPDVWLIKTNDLGDTLWTKTFGGSDHDEGCSVQQTTDGGYIIVGTTKSFGASGFDIWLIKTDFSGDTLWTKTIGGPSSDFGYSVQQTLDTGYIISGTTYSFGAGRWDIWLIKTDALGDTLWTKTFGGTQSDEGYSVCQTTDEGYIIVGYTYSYGAGYNDVWLIKTNASGDTLWTKTFGGSDYEWGKSVQQTTDEGYIIAGGTYSFGSGYEDVWLIKTNSLGDVLWTKTFGGPDYEWGNSVQQTADGGYIITGVTFSFGAGYSDVWLIKTNTSGDTLWTKTFGGIEHEVGRSIQQTIDGGYIICGNTSSFGAGGNDIWLIKTTLDITKIKQNNDIIISDYFLHQNYPNPFNPSMTIEFDLPKTSEVSLKIFNIIGEEVATLVSDRLSAGSYSYDWDASKFVGGVYLYRLKAGNYVETKKMILLK